MFCASCGRTLNPGDGQCRHCGTAMGESVFLGIPYTSLQKKFRPGDEPFAGTRAYTRSEYLFEPEEEAPQTSASQEKKPRVYGEPVQEGEHAVLPTAETPDERSEQEAQAFERERDQDIREAEEQVSEAARDLSDLKARPIASRGQSGISADVAEYMQRLESGKPSRNPFKRKKAQEEEVAEVPQEAASPLELMDEEEDEPFEEPGGISPTAMRAIKALAAIAVIAAIAVGIVFWVRHVRDNTRTSPIDGVSLELYNSGIELISSHADSAYIQSLLNTYSTDGILTLTQKLEEDANAIRALTPAEPSINDSQFISAMQSIQTNIGNAVTMDALAIAQPTDDSVEASQARWKVINDAVTMLKSATTASELEAIINGERIAVQTAAPTATPEPVAYTTLTRGDKSDDVRKMQERLWELGFLNDVRDGNFGGNTYTAVKAFQQAAGLDVTGIADNRTLTLLYSDDAPRTQNAQSATAEATTSPTEQPSSTESTGADEAEDDAANAA